MQSDLYYNKYLKYKRKYLDFRGGGDNHVIMLPVFVGWEVNKDDDYSVYLYTEVKVKVNTTEKNTISKVDINKTERKRMKCTEPNSTIEKTNKTKFRYTYNQDCDGDIQFKIYNVYNEKYSGDDRTYERKDLIYTQQLDHTVCIKFIESLAKDDIINIMYNSNNGVMYLEVIREGDVSLTLDFTPLEI